MTKRKGAPAMDPIDVQERDAQSALERVENDVGMSEDEAGEYVPGASHCSSVVGYTLHSLGLEPQQDGEVVLDVHRWGISRILTGKHPTIVGMMRDLEPLVDRLERPLAEVRGPHPFLQIARQWLPERMTRLRVVDEAPGGFLVHDSSMARSDILQRIPEFDALGDMNDADDGWPRDAASLWGACCRVVGWSHRDVVRVFRINMSEARGFAEGRRLPPRGMWARLFAEYDAAIALDTPVGIGIRWARAKFRPVDGDTREQLELEFSDAGDGPVLFVDKGEGDDDA